MSAPVLMSAYQCGPGMGSVSQIGWEWFNRLAARRPVTLLTHERNRAAIEHAGGAPAGSGIRYINTEWLAGPLYRLGKRLFPRSEHATFMVSSLDFFLFDWLATRWACKRVRSGANWALAHVVTPVTLAAPSQLHRAGLPVVRGPLNCGLHSPAGFGANLRHESEWMIRMRNIPRLLDAALGSSRATDRFLVATQAAERALARNHRARALRMIENGIDPQHFPASPWPAPPSDENPLRILFVGRLIALKGVDMLLAAVGKARRDGRRVQLQVVGDGPERESLEVEARALELIEHVRFSGALDQYEVARAMAECHLLCLPSVRESGGAVLLEAMCCGRPVVALRHGGPAEIIDDTVGAALPIHSPAQVVSDLAATFADCIANPARWSQRAAQAAREARLRYDWEAKLDQAEALYTELGAGAAALAPAWPGASLHSRNKSGPAAGSNVSHAETGDINGRQAEQPRPRGLPGEPVPGALPHLHPQ